MSHFAPTGTEATDIIRRQFSFLIELDQLKSIIRNSPLINRSRKENSAEHSWHLAMFAIVLAEHTERVDTVQVMKLLLVHDIVEIDAGDVSIHAPGRDSSTIEVKERQAAERIFGLLPEKQGKDLLDLWLEFEASATPEARFAKALDRLQPLLTNTLTDGGTWAEHGVTEQQVIARYGPAIEGGSHILWEVAAERVRQYFAGRSAT